MKRKTQIQIHASKYINAYIVLRCTINNYDFERYENNSPNIVLIDEHHNDARLGLVP